MAKRKTPTKTADKPTTPRKKSSVNPQPNTLQPTSRPSDFKGIEQLIFVDVDSLHEHPDNWKTHTKRQLTALDSEFNTVGWVLPMVYNLTTGRLLDGHGRKQTDFVRTKQKIVPVVVGHWHESEEAQILLHLDPIGGMFETDGSKFEALMAQHRQTLSAFSQKIEEHHQAALEDVNLALEQHAQSIEYGAPRSFLPDVVEIYKPGTDPNQDHRGKIAESIDDISPILPGSFTLKTWEETPFNAFGPGANFDIPFIRPDKLGDCPDSLQTWVGPETPEAEAYFYVYGCAAIEKVRSNDMIVAFYTYDEKFESIWNDPRKFTARMINLGIRSVISVNFSIWLDSPLAFNIWQTYRSRWLARYWQEAGLNVIPDLMLANLDDPKIFQIRMETIPKHAPCLAVQVQQKGDANPDAYYAVVRNHLLKAIHHLSPEKLLVYHGPDMPDYVVESLDTQIVRVKSWMWERGKILKQKDYLKA